MNIDLQRLVQSVYNDRIERAYGPLFSAHLHLGSPYRDERRPFRCHVLRPGALFAAELGAPNDANFSDAELKDMSYYWMYNRDSAVLGESLWSMVDIIEDEYHAYKKGLKSSNPRTMRLVVIPVLGYYLAEAMSANSNGRVSLTPEFMLAVKKAMEHGSILHYKYYSA